MHHKSKELILLSNFKEFQHGYNRRLPRLFIYGRHAGGGRARAESPGNEVRSGESGDERLAERQLQRLLSPSSLRYSVQRKHVIGIHIRAWPVPLRGYCSGRDIKLCDGVRAVLASSVITQVDNLP